MHLKQKGYCVGVLLIYTISTITLPAVGWCEPTVYSTKTSSPSAFQNDRNSVLTTTGLTHSSKKGGRKRLHLDSSKGGVVRSAPDLHYLENRDGTPTKTSERTVRPRMASTFTDRSVKNRDTPKQIEGKWRHISLNPPNKDCNKGEIKPVIHGNFYITGQLEANIPNVGYQSDAAATGQERIRGQQVSGSEESWQRLQPVVECGDDAMTLTVRRRRAVQLLLDRDNESSIPLSQLPPQCGYSVQTSWRDLSLVAQYDACHVTQEADSYVLPLLWRGTPVKMSCPASLIQPQTVGPPSPPSLCCSSYAMTVRVQGLSATEEPRVNVRGEWTPLVVLAEQCGYTVDRQDAEIVFTAPFSSCGITVKGGTYTLSIQMRENTFTVACPTSPPEDVPVTHQPPVTSPHHITRVPTDHLPETLEHFPQAPPFYLAPPYYPHPTYHYTNPIPDRHDAYNPLTPSSSTPEPTFGSQPFPAVASQPHYQDHYSHQIPVRESYKHFSAHSSSSSTDDVKYSDLVHSDWQQKQETPLLGVSEKQSALHSSSSDTGFPIQVPPLHAPSHAVTQYYHYYHHPKIPLPDPPQDPHPAPEVPSLTNPQNPVSPRSGQQSEALSMFNSDQFFQPVPEAASYPHTPPTTVPYTPYPPQPYPYHYLSYFPHIAHGEAKRSSPDKATKTNLSDRENKKSSTFVHPLPRSSHQGHDEYKFNPNPDDKTSPEWIKHPLMSDDIKAELEPPEPLLPHERSSLPSPSPNHNLPPYPYYYFPYYYYYQMYYGPESYPVSPSSSKEAFDPLLQTSSSPPQHPCYGKPQTTPPPTNTRDDVHHTPIHPYYNYYQLYYKPEVSVDNQDSKSKPQLHSNFDYSWTGWLVHAAEAGYPSIPQSSPFHSTYSHGIAQQHPYDRLGHPDGEEAAERLDNERKDQLKANLYTPSASPCGLGSVSDVDCIVSSGCCSYPVKDCTVGQHLIFAVPDVVEPAVATPAHPSEVNVSSTLQRVTSDPYIYIIPLDDCGVNKHVFGQTVVHLLAVQGSVHENSPVRLMVECSSSPGSPGEVRLLDHPLPPPAQSMPATVTVQLTIATDESFSSFHPETHLPLSNIQGQPVYVEVSLLDPPVSGLVLLVHSCLAYTQAPYTSWMLIHDGCSSRSNNQLLPSPYPDHIQRIRVTGFLSLPSESPPYMTNGEYSHLKDPEIFFVCLTEVCSNADGDCTVGCIDSPNE